MNLPTLFLQPLGPALLLALGGLVLALSRWLIRPSLRSQANRYPVFVLPGSGQLAAPGLGVALAVLVVILTSIFWYLLPRYLQIDTVRWTWQPLTVAGSVLEWRWDSWNWLIQGFILLTTGVALALGLVEPHIAVTTTRVPQVRLDRLANEADRTLWLAAAALVFVSSANILTLASSWLLLDITLIVRIRPSQCPETAARATLAFSLGAALMLVVLNILGESGIRTALSGRLSGLTLAALWLAALIRIGIYGLHFWLFGRRAIPRADQLLLAIVGPLTGLWLLARLHGLAGAEWLRRDEWLALGALGLFGAALVAWATEDETERWRWLALNRASLIVLAAYALQTPGPQTLAAPIVAFALGCTLLAVAGAAHATQGWRLPLWAAAFFLWGPPGTPGFWARPALVYPTGAALAGPLYAVILLADVLFAAALWRAAQGAPQTRSAGHAWRTGVALILLLAVVSLSAAMWGLSPRWLNTWLGWQGEELMPGLLTALRATRRSVWIGLAISGVGGLSLGLLRGRLLGAMRGWQQGIAAIASLEWAYRLGAALTTLADNALRYFSQLGEGEGYLGWLALAGLILWVLLRG